MERDPDYSPLNLVQHPVHEIDRLLDDFDLEPEWIGIVGSPYVEDGDIVISYNVRTIDGPYEGQICVDFDYGFEPGSELDVEQIYPAQVTAIETAFPDTTVRCYVPEAWQE